MYCFAARHNPDSYTDSYLHTVCNLSLNGDKNKYLILATPLTVKYYYILYMYRYMGNIQMYGSVQMYRAYIHVGGVMGCSNVQGAYRYVGKCTDVWRSYRYIGDVKM